MGNLSNFLRWKYKITGNLEVLEDSITRAEQSLLSSGQTPSRIRYLRNLAQGLFWKAESTGDQEAYQHASKLVGEAIHMDSASPAYRINFAMEALKHQEREKDWEAAAALATSGVELLPLASPPASQRFDQQDMLMKYGGLA